MCQSHTVIDYNTICIFTFNMTISIAASSNNTLNFYYRMAVRTHEDAFLHLVRDLVRIHTQSDCFGNAELLTLRIPMVELNAAETNRNENILLISYVH